MTLGIVTQIIGNPRKEEFKALHESIHITRTKLAHEFGDMKTCLIIGDPGIERNQKVQEAITDFIVRKPKGIKTNFPVVPLDGQITALVNHGKRIVRLRAIFREGGSGHLHPGHQQAQVIVALFQQINQIGGGTRLEPVIIKLAAVKDVQKAEGIEHAFRRFLKVITVIQRSQPVHRLVKSKAVFIAQSFYFNAEGIYQLLLRDAA